MDALSTFILNERFWLPGNTTWKDFARLEKDENIKLTNPNDLIYVYPLAGIIYVIRVLFERYVAKPIGRLLGIQDRVGRNTTKDMKTTATTVSNRFKPININQTYQQEQVVSNDSGSSVSTVRYSRITRLAKFSESCWRFTFYLSAFIYGVVILLNKSWTWDTRHCWLNYPNQPLTADIFWYYMIELAFYWSLLFSQFIDVKRKDFWQMFLHHIATIMLLSFSYIANYVRVGSLVLVIHDCADYWLEGAKMAIYTRSRQISDAMFMIFVIVWFITRICYYPYKILYTTLFEGVSILESCPAAYYVFNGLLSLLYVLHNFWFYHICRIAITALNSGQVR
ncbi:unnamed protein product [Rotaria sordida]|uniref:TLC domain-containing protein n=1 Tax=Rotaria sordida TaxID=392033 RepID=A0A815K6M1_9BILA|nr:unnamed protein product [Rotaria sordida]CAF1619579.1 unnamed protein product [Rotaria sordida]